MEQAIMKAARRAEHPVGKWKTHSAVSRPLDVMVVDDGGSWKGSRRHDSRHWGPTPTWSASRPSRSWQQESRPKASPQWHRAVRGIQGEERREVE